MSRHTHKYKKGRGNVDVCTCGRFRFNEKAGPAIVAQKNILIKDTTLSELIEICEKVKKYCEPFFAEKNYSMNHELFVIYHTATQALVKVREGSAE